MSSDWWPLVGLVATALFGGMGLRAAGGAPGQMAAGAIRGHVRLSGVAPPNPPIRMGADPACGQLNAGKQPTQEFVVKAADGGLANVFVHVQGAFPHVAAPSTPVTLEQRGCVYRPHVIGIRDGQILQVQNADPTLHNLHSVSVRGNEFNVSQLAGGPPFTFAMKHEEMMLRLTCDVHSWMNIYVAVVSHPYFAVSGRDGGFEIVGVPAGRQTVQVWHERFGPLTSTVDVPPGGVVDVKFAYTGTEKAAPPTAFREIAIPAGTLLLVVR